MTCSFSGAEGLLPLDRLLAEEGMFQIPAAQAAELRRQYIGAALAWHLDGAPAYARYAQALGFELKAVHEAGGLDRVPLLPAVLFKRPEVETRHPHAGEVLWTTSSGTKGGLSRVPRNDLTLRRFFSSIAMQTKVVLDVEHADAHLMVLGPTAAEARDLWIAYVMAGLAVFLPLTRHYVRGETLKIDEAIADLQLLAGKHVGLIGPPPFILELARTLAARHIGLHLRPTSQVITIGGWKKRSGEAVPRTEFDQTVSEALGVRIEQVRDIFNMVELNTVIMECTAKRLHIPPWLYVRARHYGDLHVLPSGETGILSFLDPTAVSYPGFLLADDLGCVVEDCACPCGRRSDILKIERRLNTVESRGCALKLESTLLG